MDVFQLKLRQIIEEALDLASAHLPEPTDQARRARIIQEAEELVAAELRRRTVGPPMAFLGCTLRQDYSDRLFQVVSVGEDVHRPGCGFAQLISLDEAREFLEADTAALLRDFAVVLEGGTSPPPVMRLGDDQ